MGRVRMPLGVLNHFTAARGPDIVRADRLPADLHGRSAGRRAGRPADPAREGRQDRRADAASQCLSGIRVHPELAICSSARSTCAPAPDGTVYIADMYHGIIQDSQWTLPGSYLRRKIEQYQLDKVIDLGRIWRLRYDGVPAVPATRRPSPVRRDAGQSRRFRASSRTSRRRACTAETPAQLVAHLAHPNGWWRDTAQRLLILKQDKSVVPALQQMARIVGRSGRAHSTRCGRSRASARSTPRSCAT